MALSRSLKIHKASARLSNISPRWSAPAPNRDGNVLLKKKNSQCALVSELKLQSLRRKKAFYSNSLFNLTIKHKLKRTATPEQKKWGLELPVVVVVVTETWSCSDAERWRMAVKIRAAGPWEVFILSWTRSWIILLDLRRALQGLTCADASVPTLSWALCDMETLCYLLLVSFVCLDHLETTFCWGHFRDAGRGSGWPALRQNEIKGGKGGGHFLNHWVNKWCESWIRNTEESITVCFKTVSRFEGRDRSAEAATKINLPAEDKCVFNCFFLGIMMLKPKNFSGGCKQKAKYAK